jgi:glutamate formiminotransferase
VSEGRAANVVRRIAEAFASCGATLLGTDSDTDHHRSVITLAGTADELVPGVVAGALAARAAIDLTQHRGAHPRMGALDVVPFVPLGDTPMAHAVATAVRAAEAIAKEAGIPTYLYGEAARRPERENLADVRRGQFEGIRDAIATDPGRAPDFGPRAVHPTAGATAVGARFFLIAFNVNLATTDLALARRIATEVREKDGGLPAVKAMGFDLPEKKQVQVSMNLVDYRQTSPVEVYRVIATKAEAAGVAVAGSEVVGLIPEAAAPEGFAETVKLLDFDEGQIVERRLRRLRGGAA